MLKAYCTSNRFNDEAKQIIKNAGVELTINDSREGIGKDELISALEKYDILIISIFSKLTADMIKYVKTPKIIATLSVGLDHIDESFLKSPLITVINAKTANTLFISQPALTARIKQIENELDVKLLQRSNKGVSFTSYGEYTAQFAIQHLKEFNNFKQKLHTFGKEVSGTLKIAVSSIIGRYYLPSLLESFHTAYPKIRFELTTIPSSEVNKLVKSHLVDFGFTKNASAFADNNKILLTTYNALIACTTPFSIENLPKMNLITYPYEESYHNSIWQWWKETFNCRPKIGTKVSNLDISKEMIFAGLGYGILP